MPNEVLIKDKVTGNAAQVIKGKLQTSAIVDEEKVSTSNLSDGITVDNTSTTILAANSNRYVAIIVNDSDEDIYLKYGSGAEMNKGIRLNSNGGTIVETMYTGIITGISTSGNKVATITEL